VEAGQVVFGPITDEWRNGLTYLNSLHDEGLYSPLSFTQADQQMIQMANDPADILGAFSVSGFTYTVMQSNPDVIARYTPVAPLMGPDGVRFCTLSFPLPKPNGVITSACEYPEEVFRLFDLMMSEEASLRRLGIQGEDWDFAQPGDISIFNTPATIRIYNQLWKAKQNTHLMEIEPYVRWLTHVDVTADSNGELDGEYINAQARMLYAPFEPRDHVLTLVFEQSEMVELNSIRGAIDRHTNTGIVNFITGVYDIHDDEIWEAYRADFFSLGLEQFLIAAQQSYERFR
ncbi:MAG: hypothetical protein LBI27_02870, partial [Clostridiales bacterium]|nr:hypothetical protein [Clostridiales bacterium]